MFISKEVPEVLLEVFQYGKIILQLGNKMLTIACLLSIVWFILDLTILQEKVMFLSS